jgi:hypothetical protein
MNGNAPFNASGVVQVGPHRFVFIDNHDSSALFEFELDADGAVVDGIRRRKLVGDAVAPLGDPEGLTRVDCGGEIVLIAASSLCVADADRSGHVDVNDGLVRVRYTAEGDLPAEAMLGFRDWLLAREPALTGPGQRHPDSGGLNIEGLAWDPRAGALVFGLRAPVQRGRISAIQIAIDAGSAPWTTASLGAPVLLDARIPKAIGRQGIRDISYDDQTAEFLIVLGRSISRGDEPFQLCTWDGRSDEVKVLDIAFDRSMKPEGITTYSGGKGQRIVVVDDRGGYAVVNVRHGLR